MQKTVKKEMIICNDSKISKKNTSIITLMDNKKKRFL